MKNIIIIILILSIHQFVYSREYDGEILLHSSYIQATKSKLVRTDTIIYQINNRQADHLAQINLLYSKGEKVTIGDSWIENLNGQIVRKLKKSEIEDLSAVSSSSLYEDRRVKKFNLKHNVYPYKIVLSYKVVVSDFFHIASWTAGRNNVPTRKMKLIVESPLDYPIRYKQENTAEPVISESAEMKRLEWNASYIPIKREINAAPGELKIPQIEVVPLHFKYGVNGSMENWQSFGNWIASLNAKAADLPESERIKVDQMLSGISNVKEKINTLYTYLQDNTRYVNVSINVGGLKSYPASYVAQNKYGDCKALCNYMQCLLSQADIKSYYTLIRAGGRTTEIDKTFPIQAFNHIILTVPLENDTVFLECTSKNTPMGYLGTFTQGRDALIIDGMNSRFVRTPSLLPDDVLSSRNIKLPLSEGIITADMNMSLCGEDYEDFAYLESETSRNEAEKYIRNNLLPGATDFTDIHFDKNRDVANIGIQANFKISNTYKKMGNNVLIATFPHNLPAYESPANRTQTLQLDFPIYYQDTIIYQMAPAYRIETTPENISIQSEFGNYTISYELNNEQFIVIKHLLIRKGIYPLARYSGFYAFISEIRKHEKNNIYIELP